MARRIPKQAVVEAPPELVWQKAFYHFHTFAYRDPRSAFASGIGLPVVSPTTVLLGIVSSLFSLGDAVGARGFLSTIPVCEVLVEAPDGIIFFRAFHQLRRYETMKYGVNPRFGFTKINQGTREYGLVDGIITLYVGTPQEQFEVARNGLTNLRHLGTSDSLCSLVMSVEMCDRPEDLVYTPSVEFGEVIHNRGISALDQSVTMVTLSRFKKGQSVNQTLPHWKMAGDQSDTELLTYVIPGTFEGTSRGKIYRKRRS